MNPYMHQYRQNQVQTASREQILIMLYDGAIQFVVKARQAENSCDRREPISRAMAIIVELSDTLDRDIGGEIADNLDGLYSFMIHSLTQANLKKEVEPLEIVEKLLRDLRETWAEAIELAKKAEQAEKDESKAADVDLSAGYRGFSAAL
jgi:flagellar secretion chaperone FliS